MSTRTPTSERRAGGGRRAEDHFALELIIERLQGLEARLEATIDRLVARFDKTVDKLEERFDRALARFESRVDELEDVFEKKIIELESFHVEDVAETNVRMAVKTEQLSRWQKLAAGAAVIAGFLGLAGFIVSVVHVGQHP